MKSIMSVFVYIQEFTESLFSGGIHMHVIVFFLGCIFFLKIVLSRKKTESQCNVMNTTHQNIIKFQRVSHEVYVTAIFFAQTGSKIDTSYRNNKIIFSSS